MKPSRFTEEQIIEILREEKPADVCRKHGISSATFFTSGRPNTAGWSRMQSANSKMSLKGTEEALRQRQTRSATRVIHMRVGRQWLQFSCAIFV